MESQELRESLKTLEDQSKRVGELVQKGETEEADMWNNRMLEMSLEQWIENQNEIYPSVNPQMQIAKNVPQSWRYLMGTMKRQLESVIQKKLNSFKQDMKRKESNEQEGSINESLDSSSGQSQDSSQKLSKEGDWTQKEEWSGQVLSDSYREKFKDFQGCSVESAKKKGTDEAVEPKTSNGDATTCSDEDHPQEDKEDFLQERKYSNGNTRGQTDLDLQMFRMTQTTVCSEEVEDDDLFRENLQVDVDYSQKQRNSWNRNKQRNYNGYQNNNYNKMSYLGQANTDRYYDNSMSQDSNYNSNCISRINSSDYGKKESENPSQECGGHFVDRTNTENALQFFEETINSYVELNHINKDTSEMSTGSQKQQVDSLVQSNNFQTNNMKISSHSTQNVLETVKEPKEKEKEASRGMKLIEIINGSQNEGQEENIVCEEKEESSQSSENDPESGSCPIGFPPGFKVCKEVSIRSALQEQAEDWQQNTIQMQSMQNQLKNKIHKLEKSAKMDKKSEHKDFNPHVWRFGNDKGEKTAKKMKKFSNKKNKSSDEEDEHKEKECWNPLKLSEKRIKEITEQFQTEEVSHQVMIRDQLVQKCNRSLWECPRNNDKSCVNWHSGGHMRRRPPLVFDEGKDVWVLKQLHKICNDAYNGQPCPKGDNCIQCHNNEEQYYHPQVYKTKACKKGCTNRICANLHETDGEGRHSKKARIYRDKM